MLKFMCDACDKGLEEHGVTVRGFSIRLVFKPNTMVRDDEEWLYLVNQYRQL